MDLVVTDPPYGIDYCHGVGRWEIGTFNGFRIIRFTEMINLLTLFIYLNLIGVVFSVQITFQINFPLHPLGLFGIKGME